ncbi:MAG: sugar ABC transporter substrate-binding protein [Syntrophomonadaceae bacterium]|jgi:ribose transport system substrate-binding protein|nr:sugar ABC transporter substrate-binding protein [Syntrophomonadaceae bacterium]
MKSNRLTVTLVLVTLIVGLFGSSVLAKGYTIGFAMKTLTNPFFIMMEEGVRQAADELGVNVVIQAADEETSIEQLVAIVETMIARSDIDAICVTPSGSTEIIPTFIKARDAGKPIIDVDVELDREAAAAAGLEYIYVGANNFEGGYMAGKGLAEELNGQGKVAIIEGIPGVDNGEMRKAGALEAFSEYPGIEVVASQTANWATEEALNVVTNILQAHPDLDGIFTANDMMAFGAINAIEGAGKAGQIVVASYDALDAAKIAIKDGSLFSSIDQRPDLQGYYGVKFAIDLLEGKEVPNRYMVPLTNITIDNLD